MPNFDQRADRALRDGLGKYARRPGTAQPPNGRQFAVALFALLRAGTRADVPALGHRAAELATSSAVSKAHRLVVADGPVVRLSGRWRELLLDHPTLRHVIVDGDPGSARVVGAAAPRPAPVRRHRRPIFRIASAAAGSGGTTGMPKLIPRTHDRPYLEYRRLKILSA